MSAVHNRLVSAVKHILPPMSKTLRQETGGALMLSETLWWLKLGGGPTRRERHFTVLFLFMRNIQGIFKKNIANLANKRLLGDYFKPW